MIERIRQALAEIAERLGLNRPLLWRARRRRKKFHERAVRNHEGAIWSEKRADELREAGHMEAAAWRDRQAQRRHHRARKSADKAQWWLGRIKLLTQRVHKLESRRDELRAELERLKDENKVRIRGNKATGGTPQQRLKAVALASAHACATNGRSNFYSLEGGWDVDHVITGVSRDKRSDCSQWVTAVYKACGLPDPNNNNYNGGYTGTQGSNGRKVSSPKSGDLILYGSPPYHHVEMYIGPGDRTIGHGSAPIDPGVIDLFGDGDYIIRRYARK